MTEISVKAKLWSLIMLMLLFIISVGAVGFVTLDRGAATLKELVDEDEAFLDLTGRVHLILIQLRRYEKDFFLNIGNGEKQQQYLRKYRELDEGMPLLLGRLSDLAGTDRHLTPGVKAKAAGLPALYSIYRNGFYDTVLRLEPDSNLTPQQANDLMGKYKSEVPILEADMAMVAQAGEEMVQQVSARALTRSRQARLVIGAAILTALVMAGVLGAALCHSIYRAIFREGLRRMAHRV